ncbi:MAG TPA: HTTM domain-containing protein, partial [Caulifigura sp.]|nr:HTTM domain-containing protein [Caulifigura sp.]
NMAQATTGETTLRQRISEFFFAEEVPYAMALLRMAIPAIMLILVVQHWPYVREIYSQDGATAPLWENYQQPGLLPIPSPTVAVGLYAVLTVVLLTACIGWQTRLSLAIATVLYTWFTLIDSLSSMTKFTVILSHTLLLLTLSNCGDLWSVDAWLKSRGKPASWPGTNGHPKSPVWPRRLIGLFVGIVYLGAAVTKMHTPGYFSGDQMAYWMLTNTNFANPLGEWLSLFPAWLVVSSYLVIIWEITFLCLCWRGYGRLMAIGFGYVFHLMTTLLLGLILFPVIYVTLYLALFNEADFQRLGQRIRRLGRRVPEIGGLLARFGELRSWQSPRVTRSGNLAAFGTMAAVMALAAIEIERSRDVFGERRPEGRYVLEPLEPARYKDLLTESQRLESVDKMFSFEVGTEMLGDVLMDRRKEFRHGENAIVQCALQPAHEDLFIEVQLRDADDRIVRRGGVVVPRENLRGNVSYQLDESFIPGDYSFVLRLDGREVARKRIRLQG